MSGPGGAATALGPLGVWSGELRFLRDRGAAREALAELEGLGFGAIWVPGGPSDKHPLLDVVEEFLGASRRVPVATGILSIWARDAAAVAGRSAAIAAAHPGRLLLGLGVSHGRFVAADERQAMRRPVTAMRAYLDALEAAVPAGALPDRVLAGLGPRMLELSRERAAGAHPYLVTPDHTATARAVLGAGALLAPEQGVVLETDPARAREVGRRYLEAYLELPNYTRNLLRLGFEEADLAAGGSDRLVDALIAWGEEDEIAARVAAHRAAGADHVTLQVLGGAVGELPMAQWRRLAALAA